MKTTYIETADTWVISGVSGEEIDQASRMANRFNGNGVKTIVVPDGFEVMKKYRHETMNHIEGRSGIYRTESGIPIENPKVTNDLRLITGVLDDAKEYESIMVLIGEDKFETDLNVLCTSLQLLGLGCDISKNDNRDRMLRIFNKEGINL